PGSDARPVRRVPPARRRTRIREPSAAARDFCRSAKGIRAMSGLNRLSATAAARKLAAREITAEALLADCLERIAEREADVHAWTFLDTDAAMRRARTLDSQGTAGLLHGLPIAVKDLDRKSTRL